MSLATLRTKWDNFIANKFAHLQSRQETYFATHGKYFQGVATNTAPADPNEVAPDLTKKPTDQPHSWSDAGITLPASVPVSLSIDTYNGPQGKGWLLRASAIIGSDHYVVCVHGAGNENRAFDWRKVKTL